MVVNLTFRERILHRLHLLPTPVMDAFASVLYGRGLAVAVRAGFFEALRDGALEPDEIARRSGLHVSGVRLLADGFVLGGYCRHRGGRYALSGEGKRWLLVDSPHSVVHLIRYFEMLHSRWAGLEETLRNGKPRAPYYAVFGDADWEAYVLGMRELSRLLLPAVLSRLTIPAGASHLLDVGGSHGLFAIECCQRFPRLTATVIDFPGALVHGAQFIRGAGLEQRVIQQAGDFLEGPLPANQDVILVFNIIHGLNEEQNRHLCNRLLGILTKGGRMYILDQLRPSAGSSRLAGFLPLMVGLNLLHEIGGTAYARSDVVRWCAHAGSIRQRKLGIPGVLLIEIVK